MQRRCNLCDRGTKIGRNRSHAQNRTARTYRANIQKVTINIADDKISGNFCTKCLKKLRKETQQKTALA